MPVNVTAVRVALRKDAHLAHESGTKVVAGMLAGDDADAQRGHTHPPQRMRERVMRGKNSTKAATSGCVAANCRSSSSASASFRPWRYSTL